VVKGYVDVENVAVFQDPLIGNAVANNLVDGRTYGFGEMAVVEGRWVGLNRVSLVLSWNGRPTLTLRSMQALWTISSM